MTEDTTTRYYLLVDDDDLAVGTTIVQDADEEVMPVVTNPRSADLAKFARLNGADRYEDIALGICSKLTPTLRLAVLWPAGDVHFDDLDQAWCDDGWAVDWFEAYTLTLGPQADRIVELVTTGVRDFLDQPDDARVAAYYDALRASPTTPPDSTRPADAAINALELRRADTRFWSEIGSGEFGDELLALAARDLVGTTVDWTWQAYDALTRPWRIAYGEPVHPDDANHTTLS